MRVRKMDAAGDYVIGSGQADFYINSPEAIGQLIGTRLGLWEGEWFLDKTVYTPYKEEILGYGTTSLRDMALKAVILGTPNVTSLLSYESSFDPNTRAFTVQGTVMTSFSASPVSFGPVTL